MAVTPAFILYLQLGDGDILALSQDGTVARPLPADSRLIANATTSLCAPQAWHDFRVVFEVVQSPPALILLSTDGYANSFAGQAGFLQVATDLHALLGAENGPAEVERELAGWLDEASRLGSGDDVTVGILYRENAP